MSKRDWLFACGAVTVLILVGILFRTGQEAEPDEPLLESRSEPIPTEDPTDYDYEEWQEYFSLPQEEKAYISGVMEGDELGANRVPLTRRVIQDAILKYDEELVIEADDIRAACEAIWSYETGVEIPEFAASLGVKRAYIAALLVKYSDDAPYAVYDFCTSAGAKSNY